MSTKEHDLFLHAMEFIIDAVALGTEGESRADVGIYLMSLMVADQKKELEPEKLSAIRQLIEIADDLEAPPFKL